MLRLGQGEIPEGADVKTVMKKPIKVRATQINEAFTVDTLEGVHEGAAGDWLMIGVEGETYPCKQHIFEKSYDIVDA